MKKYLIVFMIVAVLVVGLFTYSTAYLDNKFDYEKVEFSGIIQTVNKDEITIGDGKIYEIDREVKFSSEFEGVDIIEDLEPGLYIKGTYDASNGNVIKEITASMEPTFKGIITELDGLKSVVKPNDDETFILSSGDAVYVALPRNHEYSIGDEITVRYTGVIMETYPLGIVTVSVDGTVVD